MNSAPRLVFALAAALVAVAAGAADPQKIVLARVFPNAGQIGLFLAAADGSEERPLLATRDIDYDAVWAPDGASIVFTSDREGSADLFRVKPDGTDVQQLADNQWEEGTPGWEPTVPGPAARR